MNVVNCFILVTSHISILRHFQKTFDQGISINGIKQTIKRYSSSSNIFT